MSDSVSRRLKQYFTIEQIADSLQVSQDYIRSFISRGILKSITLPGSLDNPVRICGDSFEDLMLNCRSVKQSPSSRQVSIEPVDQELCLTDSKCHVPQKNNNPRLTSGPGDKKVCLSVFEV